MLTVIELPQPQLSAQLSKSTLGKYLKQSAQYQRTPHLRTTIAPFRASSSVGCNPTLAEHCRTWFPIPLAQPKSDRLPAYNTAYSPIIRMLPKARSPL
ncbi:MAG TPA: hypothetical protein V6D30_15995 [Leptolyngbyaceae cyanobacterium]